MPTGEARPSPHAPLSREDPRYWRRSRPADHGPDGLYRDGPHGDGCSLGRMVGITLSAAVPPSPDTARRQQAERQRAIRRALDRQAMPAPELVTFAVLAPHPRACRKAVRVVGVRQRRAA